MLKLILLLLATLFNQINSWKSCSDDKCYLAEKFENCDFDECSENDSYLSALDYYRKAYRLQKASYDDINNPQLDKLFEEFTKEVDAGLPDCYHFKKARDTFGPRNNFKLFNRVIFNIEKECNRFQKFLKMLCKNARMKIAAMDKRNVTAEFQTRIYNEWKKCPSPVTSMYDRHYGTDEEKLDYLYKYGN